MKMLELRQLKQISFAVSVIASVFFSSVAHAKRGPKPIVPPIQVNGIEFRAPNKPESEGIIEAWDPKLNKLLWSKRVYRILKDPFAEQDVQWVFIKSMSLATDSKQLVVTDERGRTHWVNIAPPRSAISWLAIAIPTAGVILWTWILLTKRNQQSSPFQSAEVR